MSQLAASDLHLGTSQQSTPPFEAVQNLCARQGLTVAEFRVLSDRFNLIVHLYPHPIVAKVATGAAEVRDSSDWVRREIEVALALAEAGAPAARLSPRFSPAVHDQDGFCISFWSYIAHAASPPPPFAAGESLARCHDALAGKALDLPVDLALSEAHVLFEAAKERRRLAPWALKRLAAALAAARAALTGVRHRRQIIHGDADWHNVLASPDGEIWIDWEDTHIGPIEWDLASAVASYLGAGNAAGARAFLAGYGRPPDTRLLRPLVNACLAREVVWRDRCTDAGADTGPSMSALNRAILRARRRKGCAPQRWR